jgi:hypothetical protein
MYSQPNEGFMGISDYIVKLRTLFVIGIVIVVVGLSTWGMVFWGGAQLREFVDLAIDKYDTYFPEITIKNGKASIKEKQPFIVDLGDNEVSVVIDTRDSGKNALDHLKAFPSGAVLTQDSLFVKSRNETRIVSIKDMPDMVINSLSLRDFADEYFPLLMRIVAVALIVYFLIAKLIQALVFAFIPYFAARSRNLPLGFGGAFKLSLVAMIPPFILGMFETLLGFSLPASFLIYFVIYGVTLVFLTIDWMKTSAKYRNGIPEAF